MMIKGEGEFRDNPGTTTLNSRQGVEFPHLCVLLSRERAVTALNARASTVTTLLPTNRVKGREDKKRSS